MKKKGETMMEFLMTYGWAILVTFAAVGALAYFGVLEPCGFAPCEFDPSQHTCHNQSNITIIVSEGNSILFEDFKGYDCKVYKTFEAHTLYNCFKCHEWEQKPECECK